jgi:hypothetical protein
MDVCIPILHEIENDLRCATGTPATGARINAQTKAQVNAQIIFPRTSVTSEMARKPFCQLRKSFCPLAQVICPVAQVTLPAGASHFDEAPGSGTVRAS